MIIGRKQIAIIFAVIMFFTILALISNWILKDKMKVIAAPSQINTIVIDAGHGGFDGGASGLNGIVEKDINLSISKKLNQILKLNGFKVVMTREDDTALCSEQETIPAVTMKKTDMRKRLQIMDETSNSLTVSIHQNKFGASSSHGAQMFYGVNNPLSETLANCIQNKFVSDLQKDNKRLPKKAKKDLFLLYFTKAPAVIVECGFISNPNEAQLLTDEKYQSKVAFTIFDGILDFLNQK